MRVHQARAGIRAEMSGLILKLRPHEELMINGVVIENGARKTLLRIKTEGAKILRLRGALKPENARTPLERACYVAQMAVGGQLAYAEAAAVLRSGLGELSKDFGDDSQRAICELIDEGDFYKIMRFLSARMAQGAAEKVEEPGC